MSDSSYRYFKTLERHPELNHETRLKHPAAVLLMWASDYLHDVQRELHTYLNKLNGEELASKFRSALEEAALATIIDGLLDYNEQGLSQRFESFASELHQRQEIVARGSLADRCRFIADVYTLSSWCEHRVDPMLVPANAAATTPGPAESDGAEVMNRTDQVLEKMPGNPAGDWTPANIAAHFGITEQAVTGWCRKKKEPCQNAYKLATSWRIPAADFQPRKS